MLNCRPYCCLFFCTFCVEHTSWRRGGRIMKRKIDREISEKINFGYFVWWFYPMIFWTKFSLLYHVRKTGIKYLMDSNMARTFPIKSLTTLTVWSYYGGFDKEIPSFIWKTEKSNSSSFKYTTDSTQRLIQVQDRKLIENWILVQCTALQCSIQ